MKSYFKQMLFSLLLVCLSASTYGYNFLFTAHNKSMVGISNQEGKIIWSMPVAHPQCADISADGKRMFIARRNGADMIDMATKKILWSYECPKIKWSAKPCGKIKKGDTVQVENPVAQILGADRFLVGNEGRSALLEINSKGDTLKEIKAESLNVIPHGEFRLASKTPRGTYLIPMMSSSLLLEYGADGRQLLRIETPSGVVGAQKLEDGSVLAGGFFGVAIYNVSGNAVWTFTEKELQKALNTKKPIVICDVKMLQTNNILCSIYSDKETPDVIEISQEKKVVRVFDFKDICATSALQPLDENLRPFAQKL